VEGWLDNGPRPITVPITAIADTTTVAVTDPRCPNLMAAHIRSGKKTYACPSGPPPLVIGAINTRRLATTTPSVSVTASRRRAAEACTRGRFDQTRIAGATSSAPIASPTHQVRHVSASFGCWTKPAVYRLATPSVALIIVDNAAANTIRPRTSRKRSSESRKPGTRESAYAPTTASSVLPVAMPAAASEGAPVSMFATSAPIKIPGHMRRPARSTAASAIPVGGQTSDANPETASSRSPTRAATMYRAATVATCPTYKGRSSVGRGSRSERASVIRELRPL
jgi:hypothetical protein